MNRHLLDEIDVLRKKPPGFSPVLEVAACFIEADGKLLFLKRAAGKPQGGKWCVPGGKVEAQESTLEAVCRETDEESGVQINGEQLAYLGKLYFRQSDVPFTFHMYHLKLEHQPDVTLNAEHEEYQWLPLEEAKYQALMEGGLEVLNHFQALADQ